MALVFSANSRCQPEVVVLTGGARSQWHPNTPNAVMKHNVRMKLMLDHLPVFLEGAGVVEVRAIVVIVTRHAGFFGCVQR